MKLRATMFAYPVLPCVACGVLASCGFGLSPRRVRVWVKAKPQVGGASDMATTLRSIAETGTMDSILPDVLPCRVVRGWCCCLLKSGLIELLAQLPLAYRTLPVPNTFQQDVPKTAA